MGMNQALTVQVAQRIQHRAEHVTCFGRSERALRENFGEIFFGVFHDHVKKVYVRQTAAAALIQLQQIGMRELGGAAPKRKLRVNRYAFGNQLDDRFRRLWTSELREENGGFAGAPQVLLQRKSIVDYLAFVLFPGKTHHCTSS